jgi:hypothetical protein
MKKIMSEKTVCDSVVGFIEKHAYCTIVAVSAITLVFAIALGFGRIDTISDPEELARLITSIAFPMTGIMVFVLNQSLSLRQNYLGKIDDIAKVYAKISATSAITLVGSAITGLLSFQYYKSGGDVLLCIALYVFLLILILLIINTVFFTIYALEKKIERGII